MLTEILPHITLAFALEAFAIVVGIPWVLMTKKESTSAVAWCLIVLFMPFLGMFLFWVVGHSHIARPLQRKRLHRHLFRATNPTLVDGDPEATYGDLGWLARRVNASPICHGNRVAFYHETTEAFEAILESIRAAKHHIHLEYFIFRPDSTGTRLIEALTQKAKEGMEVRLLYDAMGGRSLSHRATAPLIAAGGKVGVFLPLNPLRSRIQINLRNHRKIVIVDGHFAFIGGMNIGDEYLGMSKYFGYWRDQMMKFEGPAVPDLQRVFAEDWDFAMHESLLRPEYFPKPEVVGDVVLQIAESGPDQVTNSIREIYFAAILTARERLWIASPYLVPDGGLLDALRLARYRGVDVRLLTIHRPDHYLSYYAGRYYWTDLMNAGVKVYQYTRGMMHTKMVLVDGKWGMLGSANLDYRSLRLNFEAVCILHTPAKIVELEETYENDLEQSMLTDVKTFGERPFTSRLVENGCRLLSPIL